MSNNNGKNNVNPVKETQKVGETKATNKQSENNNQIGKE